MPKKVEQTDVVQEGSPVLRGKAKTVPASEIGGKTLQGVISRMKNALDAEPDGVAIAAPQIGVPMRIFVVSRRAFVIANREKAKEKVSEGETRSPRSVEKDIVCINPEITKLSKKKVQVPEGCLSVRWKYGNTMRHEKATLVAYDEKGKRFTYGGSGLIAQIFQHETDHLNGILFVDHATDIETLTPKEIAEVQARAKNTKKNSGD